MCSIILDLTYDSTMLFNQYNIHKPKPIEATLPSLFDEEVDELDITYNDDDVGIYDDEIYDECTEIDQLTDEYEPPYADVTHKMVVVELGKIHANNKLRKDNVKEIYYYHTEKIYDIYEVVGRLCNGLYFYLEQSDGYTTYSGTQSRYYQSVTYANLWDNLITYGVTDNIRKALDHRITYETTTIKDNKLEKIFQFVNEKELD